MDLAELEKTSNARFGDDFTFTPYHPTKHVKNEETGQIESVLMDFTVTIKSAKTNDARRFIVKQLNDLKDKSMLAGLQANVDLACKLTVSINGLTKDGKEYIPSDDEIREIYKTQEWLVGQVLDQANNDANFIKA